MTEVLKNKDFTLIVDRSGSMFTQDCGKLTRWQAAQEGAFALATKAAEYDEDGLTLYTFHNKFTRRENVTPSVVNQVFKEEEPAGGTALAEVLDDALSHYFAKKRSGSTKGEVFLVLTDGEPNDKAAVAKVLVDATKNLDNGEEIGFSFVQVGNDGGAKAFLNWLDDGLTAAGAKFDIVDTVSMDDIGDQPLIQVLINALGD